MLRPARRLRPLLAVGAAVFIVVRGDTSVPTPDVRSLAAAAAAGEAAVTPRPEPRTLVTVNPARALDTRNGAPLGAGSALALQVLGHHGVPVVGVDAVVLSVTAVGATEPTSVSISPAGGLPSGRIDAPTGTPASANVVAEVAADGSVTITNAAGDVHVVIDVAGYVLEP